MLKVLMAWLTMLIVSVANGALRDLTYGRYLSDLRAHQVSTLSGMVLLGGIIWAFVRFWPPDSGREALSIGLLWMTLTVAFEFLFFHFVAGRPWSELLADYRISRGRVWVLVLIWIAIAPYVFYAILRPA
ncbi:uncharacterized protein sS8_3240 [Methylocaldum marinum]|uniref:Uncharacterized protein n=1 Tax=Methylocaldum marinum TaxID=1432792 RepID=A0A250KU22_9GAMM|nr:hypothetical protein [Methylocaldum marinum]BBA35183.1 uncharacterized protein sS8_3240 [Methylocaldum marinum]